MKNFKIFLFSLISLVVLSACNKEEYAYQQNTDDLDPALYPGNLDDLIIPPFPENTNTLRNVLIEDYTGAQCTFCPNAADAAHAIEQAGEGRIFIASIHSGPTGQGSFQTTSEDYPEDFTNPQGLEIGVFFGNMAGSGFSGNPKGTISRKESTGALFHAYPQWGQIANELLSDNDLKVNLQAQSTYYPSTRGYFLYTEIDVLDNTIDAGNLAQVVYFIEDSLVGDQKMPNASHNESYIHRDIMRSCIDGKAFGRTLGPQYLNLGTEKYELYYSYKIPESALDLDNHHVLIYIYNKTTFEIYQVIEHHIQ